MTVFWNLVTSARLERGTIRVRTRAGLDKKPADVATMFDKVARRYDVTNAVLSFGQDRRWRQETVRAVAAKPGQRVLDLAAGTGVSSEPYLRNGVQVIPCDFSVGMLQHGRRRNQRLDRKSIRLNSSHVAISYAVFCLNKKNTH